MPSTNPLELVLLEWAIIIAAAWGCGRLGRCVGQSLAVGEIIGGLLLGPSGLGALWPAAYKAVFPPQSLPFLQLLADVGLILLMFQIGLKFDFGHLRTRSKTIIAVSALGILAPFGGGLILGWWLHGTFAPGTNLPGFVLFVCIALSITALPVLGRVDEMKSGAHPLAALAIGAAALDDIAGWILLALATALVTAHFSLAGFLVQVACILAFISTVLFVAGPLLRRAWQRHANDGLSGTFLMVLFLALLAACWTANRLGIFAIFGAFLLGVSLHAERELARAWRSKFADWVLMALVPVFFTLTGIQTEVGALARLSRGWPAPPSWQQARWASWAVAGWARGGPASRRVKPRAWPP